MLLQMGLLCCSPAEAHLRQLALLRDNSYQSGHIYPIQKFYVSYFIPRKLELSFGEGCIV